MSETSDLITPIMAILKQRGILCFRMQSGRIKSRGGGWMSLSPAGTADILCFSPRGHVMWIETKALKGRTHKEQRDAQETFRARVELYGHIYLLVRGIAEVEEALR
jgi:hypothetical protein